MAFEAKAPHTEWEEFLRGHPETRFIDTFMIGASSQVYGKREPAKDLDRVFSSGVTFSACAALLDVHGHGHNAAGLGSTDGDPDAVGYPIPGTLVPVPWASSPTAQCLLDMRDAKTNEPLWFDPRKILSDVVAGLHAQGLYPVVACELEFYLIDSERTEKGGIRPSRLKRTAAPPHSPQNLGLDAVEDYADFVSAIEHAAALQNIPATTAVAEYGLGQFEINLQHGNDPVLAADQAVLLKRLIRGVARSQGHDATFMGKPYMDQPGSGLHVHVSLCDKAGRNLFGSKEGEPLFYHAIAGMQAMLAESLALFAPNIASFRRFKPHNFVPVNAHWGHNNRSVALRVPLGEGQAKRIEHRASSADASPHLAVAAILSALHYGIQHRLTPTPPVDLKRADEMAPPPGATKMAKHFLAALDDLAKAKKLAGFIPARFLKAYCEMKIGEYNELFAEPSEREFNYYL